jgi:uncharacterized phage-associated protein
MTAIVRAVANELLDAAEDVRSKVDPLQLQKLLYLAQGWTLGLTGDPLFREPIEAWEYGPVVPEVYHSVKMFGASPIRGRLKAFNQVRRQVVTARELFDELESEILKAIWEKYGSWSGSKLISLTHQKGSPWWQARHSGEYNARISHSAMVNWFAEEAEKASLLNYP